MNDPDSVALSEGRAAGVVTFEQQRRLVSVVADIEEVRMLDALWTRYLERNQVGAAVDLPVLEAVTARIQSLLSSLSDQAPFVHQLLSRDVELTHYAVVAIVDQGAPTDGQDLLRSRLVQKPGLVEQMLRAVDELPRQLLSEKLALHEKMETARRGVSSEGDLSHETYCMLSGMGFGAIAVLSLADPSGLSAASAIAAGLQLAHECAD